VCSEQNGVVHLVCCQKSCKLIHVRHCEDVDSRTYSGPCFLDHPVIISWLARLYCLSLFQPQQLIHRIVLLACYRYVERVCIQGRNGLDGMKGEKGPKGGDGLKVRFTVVLSHCLLAYSVNTIALMTTSKLLYSKL